MPKTKRDQLRRTLANAYLHLDQSLGYLNQLRLAFKEQHPEHSETLEQVMTGITLLQDVMAGLAVEWWGHAPEDWESWRAQGKEAEMAPIPEQSTED